MSLSPLRRITELWNVREFIGALVLSNLRIRYRRSALGFAWSLLRPLLMVIIFTLVFSALLRFDMKHYSIFFLSAFLPWLFLSSSLTDAANLLPSHEALIKRARFPRLALLLSSVFSNLIRFLLALAVFSPFLLLLGPAPTWRLVLMPGAIALQFCLILGLSAFLAAANVFYRDIAQILDVLLMAWMYLSPIIYPVRLVPEHLLRVYRLNPMVPIIELYRAALIGDPLPSPGGVAYLAGWGVVTLVCGIWMFVRLESQFAKEV